MSASIFTVNPIAFASVYPMLINETRVQNLKPNVGANTHLMLTDQNYSPVMYFTISSLRGNRRIINIHPNAQPGSEAIYFLPYEADAATSIVLGANADFFFTSSLSGCTIQVIGPVATPTVTHANARDTYTTSYQQQRGLNEQAHDDWDENQIARASDQRANVVANTYINRLLPDPQGAGSKIMRKTDYLQNITDQNFATAMDDYRNAYSDKKRGGYRIDTLRMERSMGKPTLGSTVFGIRRTAGWEFHCQTTVGILGRLIKKRFVIRNLSKEMVGDEVVLGAVEQIFP